MKKIGEGYYYNVFEINTHTVIKTLKSKLRIFLFILFANKFNILNTNQEYNTVLASIPKLKNVYEKILGTVSNRSIIGNPLFINDTNYTQDKVKELRNINTLDEEEFTRVIIEYANLLKELWSFGISDSVFNFSVNCGYDKNNELVLVDFNEMTFDKSEVINQITHKVWLRRSSYVRLTKEKQQLFNDIFNREITLESLEKYWARDEDPFS